MAHLWHALGGTPSVARPRWHALGQALLAVTRNGQEWAEPVGIAEKVDLVAVPGCCPPGRGRWSNSWSCWPP